MTEAEQRHKESPLLSDRGATTIKDTVVSRIAGMAAGEVEGVWMGGSASRTAGNLLGNITGSDNSDTRGVSVEVGSVEAAIDLTMGIDYGKNILGTVGEVRQKITERVHSITGLNVTELNVTISDIVFPKDEQDGAEGTGRSSGADTARAVPTRTVPRQELRPGASEREVTPVEPRSRTYTEGASGPVPDEEVRAEGTPLEEDETRRLRVGDEEPSDTGTESDRTDATRTSASETPASGTSGGSHAEAPTDETTLTGGTSSGERAARETASNEGGADETEEIDRDRVSEAEERRARRRRRREERGGDGEG